MMMFLYLYLYMACKPMHLHSKHDSTVGRPPVGRRIFLQGDGGAQIPALRAVLDGAS